MTIQRIIEIHAERSTDTVKDLKTEINDLKDALLNVKEGTEDYDKGLKLLREDQQRLNEVNALTKKSVDALPGSYYALNAELVQTRKNYKELTPAERENAEVGGVMLKRIQELDAQLKALDADMGQYQRNVGNYASAFDNFGDTLTKTFNALSKDGGSPLGKFAKSLKDIIPAVQNIGKAFRTAETDTEVAAQGINKSLMSTGIGALLPLIGTLVINFGALRDLFGKHETATDRLKAATDALEESFHQMDVELENQNILLEANGASKDEVTRQSVRLLTTQMEMIQAQIDEAEATLAQLKAHSKLRQIITGEKDDIEGLEEQIEELREKEQGLYERRLRLTTQLVAEDIKTRKKQKEENDKAAEAAKKAIMTETEYQRYTLQQQLALAEENSEEMVAIKQELRELEFEEERKRLEKTIKDEDERNAALKLAEQVKNQDLFSIAQDAYVARLDAEQKFQDEMAKKREADRQAEEKAEKERRAAELAAWETLHNAKIATVQNAFTTMLSLYEAFGSENVKQSQAYKTTASAQALVQAFLSANEAYASMASIPYVGPVLGAAAAAAALAQGMAQVRAINSTNMKGTTSAPTSTVSTPTASVSAPAVIQQVESTRALTGVEEEQRMNNAQRVYLVYDDVQQAGKKVSVEQSESTF